MWLCTRGGGQCVMAVVSVVATVIIRPARESYCESKEDSSPSKSTREKKKKKKTQPKERGHTHANAHTRDQLINFYVQLVDFAARLEERGAMLATSDNAPETNFTFMRQTSNH